jgi:hypothetical protein
LGEVLRDVQAWRGDPAAGNGGGAVVVTGGFFIFDFDFHRVYPMPRRDVALAIWRELRRERERRKLAGMHGRALQLVPILNDLTKAPPRSAKPSEIGRRRLGAWNDGFPFEGGHIRKSEDVAYAYYRAAYYRGERERAEEAGAMLWLQPWLPRRR